MDFIRSLLYRFARFMAYRNGPDQLGMALIITSLIVQIIIPFTGLYWLVYLSYGLYGWAIFRFFSRNKYKKAGRKPEVHVLLPECHAENKTVFHAPEGNETVQVFQMPAV